MGLMSIKKEGGENYYGNSLVEEPRKSTTPGLIYIAVEIGQGFKQMSPAQEGITKGKGIPPGA
jgi:hypothetical protein